MSNLQPNVQPVNLQPATHNPATALITGITGLSMVCILEAMRQAGRPGMVLPGRSFWSQEG